jgi:hypothetical protein
MPIQELSTTVPLPKLLDLGVGFNWFGFLGSGGFYARDKKYCQSTQVFPSIGDVRGWDLVLSELDRLKPGCIRFGLNPDAILDEQGRLIKDSPLLQQLDIIAGWCRRNDSVFILDPFVIPEYYEFPITESAWTNNGMLNMAARDNREYAEKFVAPLLDHLVRERGWDNIIWFNPVNEPFTYGVYQTPKPGPDDYIHYVEMYGEIRRALDSAGLNQIRLIGIDSCDPMNFPVYEFTARGVDLDPHIDAYSVHTYVGRFDYELEIQNWNTFPLRTLVDTYIKRLVSYTESRGKPMYALEFGSYHGWTGDWASNSGPSATIYTAESVLRMVNAGVRGLMYWEVTDSNENDGWWNIFRVERDSDTHRLVRGPHTYSTYRMLMNFMPRNSRVFPLVPGGRGKTGTDQNAAARMQTREYPAQHVWATALEAPDGGRHLLVVNDHPNERREVLLNLPQGWENAVMRMILKDQVRLGEVMSGEFTTGPEGQLHITLPPLSLVVITNKPVESMLPI